MQNAEKTMPGEAQKGGGLDWNWYGVWVLGWLRIEAIRVQAACEAGDYATSWPTKTATKNADWRPTFGP